jgi:tetratricopeptide (TPR) repeat protein
VTLPAEPNDAERTQAMELASEASQAEILGNAARARDLLARATDLDGRDSDLAYRYGRALEDLGARSDAIATYCRVLALAEAGVPAPEADEARKRMSALVGTRPAPPSEAARAALQRGLDEAAAGRTAAAARAFAEAVAQAPDWPDAHYNEGAVLARLGRDDAAVAALRRYLDLAPAADDAVAVSERIGRLEAPSGGTNPSPATALGLGLAPGLGQVYTGRPGAAFGILALAGGITGASAWAECCGERTFVTPGLYLAGAVTAIGALEAYFTARRLGRGRAADVGGGGAFALGLLPGMGQFYRGRTGAGYVVLTLATSSAATAFLYENDEGRGFYETGLATAGLVTALTALEAAFEAERRRHGPGARPPDPAGALALGLLPGLGQFYQGRLDTGLGFLSLVAGITTAADLAECCEERRFVGSALGVAAGVTAIGALEAFLDARRVAMGADPPPPMPGLTLALGVIPGLGHFYAGRTGAGMTVLSLAAASATTAVLADDNGERDLYKAGLITAGAVTAIGAVEAFVNALGRQGGDRGGLGDGPPSAATATYDVSAPGSWRMLGPALVGGGPGLRMRLVGARF